MRGGRLQGILGGKGRLQGTLGGKGRLQGTLGGKGRLQGHTMREWGKITEHFEMRWGGGDYRGTLKAESVQITGAHYEGGR